MLNHDRYHFHVSLILSRYPSLSKPSLFRFFRLLLHFSCCYVTNLKVASKTHVSVIFSFHSLSLSLFVFFFVPRAVTYRLKGGEQTSADFRALGVQCNCDGLAEVFRGSARVLNRASVVLKMRKETSEKRKIVSHIISLSFVSLCL